MIHRSRARPTSAPPTAQTGQFRRTPGPWWHAPARIDEQVTCLSHGLEFDARKLLSRVDALIHDTHAGVDRHPELVVLRRWVLDRLPHLMVTTVRVDAVAWEGVGAALGADRRRPTRGERKPHRRPRRGRQRRGPRGVGVSQRRPVSFRHHRPGRRDRRRDLAPTVRSGHRGRHADRPHDPILVESYGGDPFAPGPFWWQSDTFAEQGPHQQFASRYIHPYTGDVEIALARMHGFADDDRAEIHRLWTA